MNNSHEVAGRTWVTRHNCLFWFQNEAASYPDVYVSVMESPDVLWRKFGPELAKNDQFWQNLAIFEEKKVRQFAVAWESGAIHV